MEFKNPKEAVDFLKSLDTIIMPPQFTYFNHCTCYQSLNIQSETKTRGTWTSLPLHEVVLTKEMSFVERDRRIKEALDYGGVENAMVSYKTAPLSKNFILRVIIPKNNLGLNDRNDLGITDEYQKKLDYEYRGLGDGRHPKLNNGEKILIFASSTVDEVSGKNIDIFYGVREQDVIIYANKIASELQKQSVFSECKMLLEKPISYSIKKSKDFSRYEKKWLIGENGPVKIGNSEFDLEYQQDVKRELNDMLQKKIKKLEYSLSVQISSYIRQETITTSGVIVNNVPKTFEQLQNEQEEFKYKIDFLYYSGAISELYKEGLIKDLNYIYEQWKSSASKNRKASDGTTNSSPQAIPLKEIARFPTGSAKELEVPKKHIDQEKSVSASKQYTDFKQTSSKNDDPEEKNIKSLDETVSMSMFDEFGIEISRINEEINTLRQYSEEQELRRRR